MSLANNDYNWRLTAAADIAADLPVTVNGAGKVAVASNAAKATCAVGFTFQATKSGDRVPVMRGGKLNTGTARTAGQIVYLGAAGALVTSAPAGPAFVQRLGYVPAEDLDCIMIDIQPIQTVLVGA